MLLSSKIVQRNRFKKSPVVCSFYPVLDSEISVFSVLIRTVFFLKMSQQMFTPTKSRKNQISRKKSLLVLKGRLNTLNLWKTVLKEKSTVKNYLKRGKRKENLKLIDVHSPNICNCKTVNIQSKNSKILQWNCAEKMFA